MFRRFILPLLALTLPLLPVPAQEAPNPSSLRNYVGRVGQGFSPGFVASLREIGEELIRMGRPDRVPLGKRIRHLANSGIYRIFCSPGGQGGRKARRQFSISAGYAYDFNQDHILTVDSVLHLRYVGLGYGF
jgi:hypothetical protein